MKNRNNNNNNNKNNKNDNGNDDPHAFSKGCVNAAGLTIIGAGVLFIILAALGYC
jgi:hypothetical protein